MKEPEPRPQDYPIAPQNPEVEKILFGGSNDVTLRQKGFKPREVSNWGISLIRGSIPEGFASLEEFENHILSTLKGPENS